MTERKMRFITLRGEYIDTWDYHPSLAKRGQLLWLGSPEKLYRVSQVEHKSEITLCFMKPETSQFEKE